MLAVIPYETFPKITLGPIELRAADPQVHQDPHHLIPLAVVVDQLGELLETSLDDMGPIPEGSEPETSGSHPRDRVVAEIIAPWLRERWPV